MPADRQSASPRQQLRPRIIHKYRTPVHKRQPEFTLLGLPRRQVSPPETKSKATCFLPSKASPPICLWGLWNNWTEKTSFRVQRGEDSATNAPRLTAPPATWICQTLRLGSRRPPRGSAGYDALSEKSSKIFCCPASPSARRTASWKSIKEYRPTAGGVSAPFDNMVRRSLVAARTSASGWEPTQRGSHHPRTVAVE
jgi:hypothetical protein